MYDGMVNTIAKFKPMLNMELHRPLYSVGDTIAFFYKLRSDGYEIKYLINRAVDMPLACNPNDIELVSIEELLDKLRKQEKALPDVFHLFLINKDYNPSI
jgi:hypothetical protein